MEKFDIYFRTKNILKANKTALKLKLSRITFLVVVVVNEMEPQKQKISYFTKKISFLLKPNM